MSAEPIDPVAEQLAAYNARDLERFTACFAPNVRAEDGRGRLLWRGHRQLRARYGPAFAKYPDARCEIMHRRRIGAYVVDEERITGLDVPVTQAVVIYRLAGDRIAHVRFLGGDDDRWTAVRRRVRRLLRPLRRGVDASSDR